MARCSYEGKKSGGGRFSLKAAEVLGSNSSVNGTSYNTSSEDELWADWSGDQILCDRDFPPYRPPVQWVPALFARGEG